MPGYPPPLTPPTTTPNCATNVTAPDAFVAKINPAASAGAQLLYSTYLGGTGDDVGYGIAVDTGLSAYVTGSTTSTDFTIPSGTTPSSGAWILRRIRRHVRRASPPATLSSASSELRARGPPAPPQPCLSPISLIWAVPAPTWLWASPWIPCRARALLAGPVRPTFRLPTIPSRLLCRARSTDLWRASIPRRASTIALGHYGTYLGGSGSDFATSIATDAQGNSYAAGETASANFPTANPIQALI